VISDGFLKIAPSPYAVDGGGLTQWDEQVTSWDSGTTMWDFSVTTGIRYNIVWARNQLRGVHLKVTS
jgi:hypothetical protein